MVSSSGVVVLSIPVQTFSHLSGWFKTTRLVVVAAHLQHTTLSASLKWAILISAAA